MENPYILPLSLITFLPAIGALVLAFFPRRQQKRHALVHAGHYGGGVHRSPPGWQCRGRKGPITAQFSLLEPAVQQMQDLFSVPWIKSFNIYYLMGTDGISFPLVILTSFICMLAMGASWNIDKHVKAYCILFLLLETGMIGVFLALDFFLFYVFWEVMLLPMYFLIGVWGGPRKEYAAIKFFLYTLVGSVLMLIAILMLYFNSDLRLLSDKQLVGTGVVDQQLAGGAARRRRSAKSSRRPSRSTRSTFWRCQAMGQMPNSPFSRDADRVLGKTLQWWAFLLLFIGFAIKVPAVPLHTWLPDAHVEAPTPISMILAGVLLKMGGYGIIRICYPICPDAGYDLAWFVCGVGVLSMVYGAFAAMAQKDFKRLVAYSSVSHMGYVVLGLGVWSATAQLEIQSRLLGDGHERGDVPDDRPRHQLGRHVLYGRRDLRPRASSQPGRVRRAVSPACRVYSGLAIGIFFAGLGLPGLCGFIGEVLVTLVGLEFQPHAGGDFRGDGHSDGRIHSVDDSARLSGGRNTKARTAIICIRSRRANWPSPRRCWRLRFCSASIRRRCSTT